MRKSRLGRATLSGVLLAALSLPAAAATSPSSWSTALSPVPSHLPRAGLGDVSCPTATFCVQVSHVFRGEVSRPLAVIRDGADISAVRLPLPTDAEQPDTVAGLNAVDCVSQNYCVAVGSYTAQDARGRPLVETYRNGTWRAAAGPWPEQSDHYGPDLDDIACNTSSCVATGDYYNAGNKQQEGFLAVRDRSGAWSSPKVNAAIFAVGVHNPTCPPDGPCYAQGYGYDFAVGHNITQLLYPAASGWNSSTFPAPAGADAGTVLVGAMSCPSQEYCAGLGAYRDSSSGRNHLALEQLADGRLSAREIPISAAAAARAAVLRPGPTSCGAIGAGVPCAAAATFDDSGHAVLVRSTGGSWHAGRAPAPENADPGTVSIADVSCSGNGRCAAVGWYSVGRRTRPVAENLTGSAWQATRVGLPNGVPATDDAKLTSVSCRTGSCMASGTTTLPPGYYDELIYALFG